MTDHFAALRIFIRLAHLGSFSKAAHELNISQPTASRMISDLESHLGVTLFTRTTRSVSITQAGAEYLDLVQPILTALGEADHQIGGSKELRGTLRVSMASVTASRIILPQLKTFMDEHPKLEINLSTDDRRQDLIADGIDVALRSGTLADSSALARQIGTWPLILAAAPAYLLRHGIPATALDLAAYPFVIAGPMAGQQLLIKKGDQTFPFTVAGKLTVQGTDAAVAAGRSGLGMVIASHPSLAKEIEDGTLIRILPDWDLGRIGIHALFPSGQPPKPSARAFVEFAIAVMGRERQIDHWPSPQLDLIKY